ncbi:MAG TPA: glycine cleavage system protein GcvH [Gammaproteobacteria bacterium]|nr:glycine cleavage system protein GcvH [Gammaproteobacteria bacterium]
MSAIRYTPTHEWVRAEADGTMTIGITDFAQQQLGDIVFIELPEVGRQVTAGEPAVVIESVKAAADVNIPIAGEIIDANTSLGDAPETVNQDPMQAGWIVKIRPADSADVANLLDQDAYDSLTAE